MRMRAKVIAWRKRPYASVSASACVCFKWIVRVGMQRFKWSGSGEVACQVECESGEATICAFLSVGVT